MIREEHRGPCCCFWLAGWLAVCVCVLVISTPDDTLTLEHGPATLYLT